MAAAVLLAHQLPDGSEHLDWLIQRPDGTDAPLISFRVRERIDSGVVERFKAERIADHRPLYLTYEGPLSGGRGAVRRVATGDLALVEESAERVRFRGHLGEARGVFWGELMSDGRWLFGFAADPEAVG